MVVLLLYFVCLNLVGNMKEWNISNKIKISYLIVSVFHSICSLISWIKVAILTRLICDIQLSNKY